MKARDSNISERDIANQNITSVETKLAHEEIEEKNIQIEKLVNMLPEPPLTNPEISEQDKIAGKGEVDIPVEQEPPDKVEIPMEHEPPDKVEIAVKHEPTAEMKVQAEDTSGTVHDASKSDTTEPVVESHSSSDPQDLTVTKPQVDLNGIGVIQDAISQRDPSFIRSESFYSAVSSIEEEGGERNLDVDFKDFQQGEGLEIDSKEDLTIKENASGVDTKSDMNLTTNKEETISDVPKISEHNTESSRVISTSKLEQIQNEELTVLKQKPSSPDELYPVLDKFVEQISISSEKLEVISCSVGPSVGTASAPQFEVPVERPSEGHTHQTVNLRARLQPLTQEQLQSLYYNAQLANNPAYIDRFIQVGSKDFFLCSNSKIRLVNLFSYIPNLHKSKRRKRDEIEY